MSTNVETGHVSKSYDSADDNPVDQLREKAVHYQDYKQFKADADGNYPPGGFYNKTSPEAGQAVANAGNQLINRLGLAPDDMDAAKNTAGVAQAPRPKLGEVGGQQVQLKYDSTGLFNIQKDNYQYNENTIGLRAESHHDLGAGFDHVNVTRAGAYTDSTVMSGADGFDLANGDFTGRASYAAQAHAGVGVVTEGSINDSMDNFNVGLDYRGQAGLEAFGASRGAAYLGPLGAAAGIEGQAGVRVLSGQLGGKAATDFDALRIGETDINPSVEAGAKAYVGAEARGQASVSFTPTNLGAKVGGEAFAGAKAAAYGAVGLGEVGKVGGGVEAYAGVGVKGEAKLEFEDGKLSFGLSAGAALGVGLGAEVKVELDFSAIADLGSEAIKGAIGIANSAINTAMELGQDLGEQFGEWAETFSAFAQDQIDNFTDMVSNGFNTVTDGIEHIGNTIAQGVENFGNTLADGITGVGDAIAGGIETATDFVAGGIETVGNAVGGAIEAVGNVADAVGEGVNNFVQGVGEVGSAIGDAAGDVIDAAGNALNEVGGAIGDAADAVGGAISDGVETVGNAISDGVGKVGKAIGGIFGGGK
ncbi:MAG: hypothetical protein ACFCBW_07615 [Candidatus Competibacterales bacterium]